jgi:hypothetical protein
LKVVAVNAERDHVALTDSREPPHGSPFSARDNPGAIDLACVRPLVQAFDRGDLQMLPRAAIGYPDLRHVMPDPFVGCIPDAFDMRYRREKGEGIETDDDCGFRLRNGHSVTHAGDVRFGDAPERSVPALQPASRWQGICRRIHQVETEPALERQAIQGFRPRFRGGGQKDLVTEAGARLHRVVRVDVVAGRARPGERVLDEQQPHRI